MLSLKEMLHLEPLCHVETWLLAFTDRCAWGQIEDGMGMVEVEECKETFGEENYSLTDLDFMQVNSYNSY